MENNNLKTQLEKRVSKKTGKAYFCYVLYFEYNGEPKQKIFPLFTNDYYITDLLNKNAVEVK